MIKVKDMKKTIFLYIFILWPIIANAEKVDINGISYNLNTEDKTAEVISKSSGEYSGDIIIPGSVTYENNNYTIISIGNRAFCDCRNLTSLVIFDNIEKIGDLAFYRCTGLKSLSLPQTITDIGEEAFFLCNSLLSLVIPEGVKSLGRLAVSSCNNLLELKLPSTLISLGKMSVDTNPKLEAIICNISDPFEIEEDVFNNVDATLYVPVGSLSKYKAIPGWDKVGNIIEDEVEVNEIDGFRYRCLYHAKKAILVYDEGYTNISNLNIPATIDVDGNTYSLTEIGNCAFLRCSKIITLTLPNSVTKIGGWAFQYCENLNSVLMSNSLKSIGESAFNSCRALKNISLPVGLESIGDEAFRGCDILSSLVVPEGVKSIGISAFQECSKLQKLEIPSTLSSVGYNLIYGCSSLEVIISHMVEPFIIEDNLFASTYYLGNNFVYYPSPITLCVPKGSKSRYETIPGWCKFRQILEDEVKEYTDGKYSYFCFNQSKTATIIYDDNYNRMNSVELPSFITVDDESYKITSIGNCAFANSNITSAIIPNSVELIGFGAFQDCSSLLSVLLPESLTEISDYGFYNCDKLQSFVVPEGVNKIGNQVFSNCDKLQKLELPSSLTSIGDKVIIWCEYIDTVISNLHEPFIIDLNVFSTFGDVVPATLYVPSGTKEKYESIPGWNVFKEIIEIKEGTSINSTSLTAVTDNYFNLQGQKVYKPTKGLYINNGKKVVLK